MTERKYDIAMGSYAFANEPGVQMLTLNPYTGQLFQTSAVSGVLNPSFLVMNEENTVVYAVSEHNENGEVVALRYDSTSGDLTELNRQSTCGGAPCHITIDASGKWLLGVNYMSGSVFVFSIEEDGQIGKLADLVQHSGSSVHPVRQTGPHTHSIFNIPGTDLFIVCDLGLDKVYVYELIPETGTLHERWVTDVLPGSGPRHVAFHPKRPIVYVIQELSCAVSVFRYDVVDGKLEVMQPDLSTLPAEAHSHGDELKSGFLAADIHIATLPTGTYLYASTRGHDSLAVYQVAENGRLTPTYHVLTNGSLPRNFLITEDNRWLLVANQGSDSVVVMKIGENGLPTPTGETYSAKKPVCLIGLGG